MSTSRHPGLLPQLRSSSSTCACTVTSSAVVGSSAISTLAARARWPWRSARAGACRRRTGADSRRRARCGSGICTRASSLDGALARLAPPDRQMRAQHLDDLVADREHRVQRGQRVLEHHARCRAPRTPPQLLGRRASAGRRHRTAPRPAMTRPGLGTQPERRGGRSWSCRSPTSPTTASVSPVRTASETSSTMARRPAFSPGTACGQAADREMARQVAACSTAASAVLRRICGSSVSRSPSPSRLKRDDGEGDAQPRRKRDPRIGGDQRLPVGDDVAPGRRWRLHAEAEEGQARLGQDGGRRADRRDDDHRRHRIRDDVPQ